MKPANSNTNVMEPANGKTNWRTISNNAELLSRVIQGSLIIICLLRKGGGGREKARAIIPTELLPRSI